MAHERIHGDDIAANLIIQWNDDGNVVSIGMEWDDPGATTSTGVVEAQVPVESYQLRPYFNETERRWSIYMSFDRARLNRLIQATRRARNKAFGADE